MDLEEHTLLVGRQSRSGTQLGPISPIGQLGIRQFAPTPAGAGRPGNAGVGICEGPGTVTVACGLAKSFLLTENVRMRFEATFSNIWKSRISPRRRRMFPQPARSV
jgi:hypothetical protein